jgi:hypothetical protein
MAGATGWTWMVDASGEVEPVSKAAPTYDCSRTPTSPGGVTAEVIAACWAIIGIAGFAKGVLETAVNGLGGCTAAVWLTRVLLGVKTVASCPIGPIALMLIPRLYPE